MPEPRRWLQESDSDFCFALLTAAQVSDCREDILGDLRDRQEEFLSQHNAYGKMDQPAMSIHDERVRLLLERFSIVLIAVH